MVGLGALACSFPWSQDRVHLARVQSPRCRRGPGFADAVMQWQCVGVRHSYATPLPKKSSANQSFRMSTSAGEGRCAAWVESAAFQPAHAPKVFFTFANNPAASVLPCSQQSFAARALFRAGRST